MIVNSTFENVNRGNYLYPEMNFSDSFYLIILLVKPFTSTLELTHINQMHIHDRIKLNQREIIIYNQVMEYIEVHLDHSNNAFIDTKFPRVSWLMNINDFG